MEYRIWLDDLRPMPAPDPVDKNKWFNFWCKTADEAIELIDI